MMSLVSEYQIIHLLQNIFSVKKNTVNDYWDNKLWYAVFFIKKQNIDNSTTEVRMQGNSIVILASLKQENTHKKL